MEPEQSNVVPVVIKQVEPEPDKSVWQKYVDLLSSPRFHQLFVVFVLQTSAHYFLQDDFIFDSLSALLLGVVGVGTADSIAKKIAGR